MARVRGRLTAVLSVMAGGLLVTAGALAVTAQGVTVASPHRRTGMTPPTGAAPSGPARPPSPSVTLVPAASSTSTTLAAADVTLVAQLRAALDGKVGCALASQGGRTVAIVGGGVALAAASTQKLVVAASALGALGPGFRFVTRVEAPGPVTAGVAPHLWLVGEGDPMLSTAGYGALVVKDDHYGAPAPLTPLEGLAQAIHAAGIVSVPGGISGDESRLSSERYLPTWKPVYLREDDVGPLSALSLNEGWQQWTGQTLPAVDPPAYAASALTALLRPEGIATGAPGPDGPAPPGALTVATISSAPLAQIVAYMLATSDNHVAELLTRELGLSIEGQGTTAAGTAAVLSEAARLGLAMAGVTMVDGSGLSPQNRSTCAELLSAYALGARPAFGALRVGLPVAGRSGTLYRQWRGTPLAGRVLAKTGWIDGAAAIVGTVGGREPVDFAFAVNGTFSYAAAVAMQTQALNALLAFSGA